MTKHSVTLPEGLERRLKRYITKRFDQFYGKIQEVMAEALDEYLAKREAEEDVGD